jgi:hypothetical protein
MEAAKDQNWAVEPQENKNIFSSYHTPTRGCHNFTLPHVTSSFPEKPYVTTFGRLFKVILNSTELQHYKNSS